MWNNPVVTGRCSEILPVLVQNNRNIVHKLVFLGDTAAPVLMERSRINHSDPQTAVTYMPPACVRKPLAAAASVGY